MNISFTLFLIAPIHFSFNPPIGKIFPLRVISPVIAILLLMEISVKALIRAVISVTPALGPSLLIEQSGT